MNLASPAFDELCTKYLNAVRDGDEVEKERLWVVIQSLEATIGQWKKIALCGQTSGDLNNLAHQRIQELKRSEIDDPGLREFFASGPHP